MVLPSHAAITSNIIPKILNCLRSEKCPPKKIYWGDILKINIWLRNCYLVT